jgi:hypothetical protein
MKKAFNAGGHHSLEQQLALEAELQSQAADRISGGARGFSANARRSSGCETLIPIADRWFEITRIDDGITCCGSPMSSRHALQYLACAGP